MMTLKGWQWAVVVGIPASLGVALAIIAGIQIHAWGLTWMWGGVTLGGAGWWWLLGRWTRPDRDMTPALEAARSQLQDVLAETAQTVSAEAVEAVLRDTLEAARDDAPLWEDWPTFRDRALTLVQAIARLYHPEVKYPLLNIYVPQAYGLIRGTVDDLDRWMQMAAPALNQVTVAQVYQGYERYRAWEKPLRQVGNVLELVRWVWNPVAAVARQVGRPVTARANQQLVLNFSHILREMALTLLCRQAIALYGGKTDFSAAAIADDEPRTETLEALLAQAETTDEIAAEPVNLLLVGRTGAGKSSLINTLFQAEQAETDVRPNTDTITHYRWESSTSEPLILWDSPGYEQVNRAEFREQVLAQVNQADMLVLVTPALDAALDADLAFLTDVAAQGRDLPIWVVVTQVDRLSPRREWQPPYDWQQGDRPKERNMRDAVAYRQEQFGDRVQGILPLVTAAESEGRDAWGSDALAVALVTAIAPAKAQRLAQFLRSREARITAAARLIDRYAQQMTTTQGLVALLKQPAFALLSARLTGSPDLGALLAKTLPAEQVPVVASLLMLTDELADLLDQKKQLWRPGAVLNLLSVMTTCTDGPPAQVAWAWGHALVEDWTQPDDGKSLRDRIRAYLHDTPN